MLEREIDPDLERQLASAKEDEPVEAVLLLKGDDRDKPPIDVEALMKRVCDKDQGEEIELNYMPRIGALIVRASSRPRAWSASSRRPRTPATRGAGS